MKRSTARPGRLRNVFLFYIPLILGLGWWLWMSLGHSAAIRDELAAVRHEKHIQDLLHPFMSQLAAQNRGVSPAGLKVPISRPLSRKRVTELGNTIRESVAVGNATVVSVVPRSMELGEKYDRVPVDIVGEGDLSALRELLMALCRLPFVAAFEEVGFQSRVKGGIRMTVVVMIEVA